ncbi:lipoprotein BA_5634 family protein [Bacillus toyonensis]|uniref:lipoprotein BA_5634 family protein n=1 Tax=Bacillus toyonensis TaxID=155322 RepID=UPI0015D4BB82|nr:lipoprotein BA_5634 family protein [Bacillus toyonensis]
MKKILSICGIGVLVISMLGACSLFGGNKEPRNGLMLLGEQQALKKIETEHKKEIKSATFYKVKQEENSGKNLFIMNEKTAEEIVKRGILREKDDDGYISTSTPLSSLPKIKDKEALVFADPKHTSIKNVEVNGIKIQAKYESNSGFGFPRWDQQKEELLLVVDNDIFQKIPSPEMSMSIIELNKTYGENKAVNSSDIEAVQAQNEFEKLQKSMQGDVKRALSISIMK